MRNDEKKIDYNYTIISMKKVLDNLNFEVQTFL